MPDMTIREIILAIHPRRGQFARQNAPAEDPTGATTGSQPSRRLGPSDCRPSGGMSAHVGDAASRTAAANRRG